MWFTVRRRNKARFTLEPTGFRRPFSAYLIADYALNRCFSDAERASL